MKNILCIIYSIHGGGAERNMQHLLRRLDRAVYRPHLCVFSLTGKERDIVPPDVQVHYAGTRLRPASFFIALKLIPLVARLRPDHIVSFMWKTNLLAILAGRLTKTKVLVSERIYTPQDIGYSRLKRVWRTLISLLYPKADAIVAVSTTVKQGLASHLSVPPERIAVISTGVDLERLDMLAKEYTPPARNYIVSCGRLERQKNFGALIDSVASAGTAPLVIAGKGSERTALEERAKKAGVSLDLPGYLENPYPWIRHATIFAFTSRYEGFPVVLLETMALRVPIVAMECPGIDSELIENGVTGILVPQGDIPAMGAAIRQLLADEALRKNISEKAYLRAKERFSLDAMLGKYERLLQGGN